MSKLLSKFVPYKKKVLIMMIIVLIAALITQIIPIIVFAADNDEQNKVDPFYQKAEDLIATYKASHENRISPEVEQLYEKYSKDYKELNEKSGFLSFAYLVASIGMGVNPVVDVGQFGTAMLTIRNTTEEGSKTLLSYVEDAYSALKVTGLTLMLLYFFLSIMDKITSEQLSTEMFIRKLILLAVGIITILYGYNILYAILDYSNYLITDTGTFMDRMRAATSMEKLQQIRALLDAGNSTLVKVITALGVIIKYLMFFLCQLAMTIVVFVVGVSRLIEIIIRMMFAPIALAPIVHDGMRSTAFRYIKKFAACCINGAVIVCIAYLATTLPTFFKAEEVGVVFAICANIAFPLATIALVFRCQNIADDIIGVHG